MVCVTEFSAALYRDELSVMAEIFLSWIVQKSERLLLTMKRSRDSWPLEEKNSIQDQKQGLIAQSFCVIKFY